VETSSRKQVEKKVALQKKNNDL